MTLVLGTKGNELSCQCQYDEQHDELEVGKSLQAMQGFGLGYIMYGESKLCPAQGT
jgi:hypothetical protein